MNELRIDTMSQRICSGGVRPSLAIRDCAAPVPHGLSHTADAKMTICYQRLRIAVLLLARDRRSRRLRNMGATSWDQRHVLCAVASYTRHEERQWRQQRLSRAQVGSTSERVGNLSLSARAFSQAAESGRWVLSDFPDLDPHHLRAVASEKGCGGEEARGRDDSRVRRRTARTSRCFYMQFGTFECKASRPRLASRREVSLCGKSSTVPPRAESKATAGRPFRKNPWLLCGAAIPSCRT